MARRYKSKRKRGRPRNKPRFGKVIVTEDTIELICNCGKRNFTIPREPGDDTGDLLAAHAKGWYTCISGVAMCPTCVGRRGGIRCGPGGKIHGETDAT